ncbi:glycosyltransferase family 4 protein [Pikeienuella piscinae]|uniref:Glycosyltransferase family 4 protein n=1 Tax=Pikeienuella piscinae TaxID=2748098 RepID=A0A7L5BW46_9RHOB|nr:glycosyltransferase family 4 protein [Pikeienuella piscinae]QIE55942.1 glycosyltransferase family 4 protein [Pikeienuella piscinae]
MKIVVTANTSFNLVNFRSGFIRALQHEGHEVIALAPFDECTDAVRTELGCRIVELKLDRRGTSPPREVASLFAMFRAIRRIRPDIIFSYTIKNNLYGGMAARLTGTPIIPNITGLGTLFSSNGALTAFAGAMYRQSFRTAPVVFFQNLEDRDEFIRMRAISAEKARLLPGSGVDLERFSVSPPPSRPDAPVFLLIGRLLWEKGVGQFVEAARQVRAVCPGAEFRIAGGLEAPSSAAIPEKTVAEWVDEGIIDYLGQVRDVRPALRDATCVVLPTYYREGTPRSLLEAAACGRPVITTDTAGCRTVVRDHVTGYLIAPKNSDDLARAMAAIARASPAELTAMGSAGRAHIEEHFDERIVIKACIDAMGAIEKRPEVGVR